ncbi:hypothetical protein [Actinomadura citrea]|uniref:Uncharacterized protein n=1 Tax=Actinomadura citrea TaxID=46158 RepID=A0A7Y9GAL7_9ACTN|nr:hypothetical protein [Actinomadura citrea]NYE13009.1 hypothetical protein [Actinomadura citrea]GGT89106.1 hypothetical protein GCM10010177_55490 [Actinomadura citrea]
MIAAIEHLEKAVLGAVWTEGVVLRYGGVLRIRHVHGTRLSAAQGALPAIARALGPPRVRAAEQDVRTV